MKEQLISFETAKLAKEKGFVNGSKSYYTGNDELHTYDEKFHPNALHKNNMMQRFRYEVPIQSLLQKWLREEHSIDLWFGQLNPPNKYHVEDIVQNDIIIGGVNEGSAIYEDALEKGLFEALKLI